MPEITKQGDGRNRGDGTWYKSRTVQSDMQINLGSSEAIGVAKQILIKSARELGLSLEELETRIRQLKQGESIKW